MYGIVSYGYYLPQYRITVAEIAKTWGKRAEDVERALKVHEKTVSGRDEDALTMAYAASEMAFDGTSLSKEDIGAVFVGSESHPYIVNPTSTILAEFLGIEGEYLASDVEFACKAATGALITISGLVRSGSIKTGLVVAADKASSKPQDPLEYTASSGSVACVLGRENVAVEIIEHLSFSSDTPDFWRREGSRYPTHGGRFTGKPSYFKHVMEASSRLLKKSKLQPKAFDHAVFHMPNGKFPRRVANALGFTSEQLVHSLTVDTLGNSYTASALMGLVSVLSHAKADELIFLCSFGSGAGSDAFILRTTKHLGNVVRKFSRTDENKTYINYPTYLRYTRAL